MIFSGLHSLEQPVYYLPQEHAMAIAILVSQKVTREMVVQCSGHEPIQSLQTAYERISNVRIISLPLELGVYTYHGVWVITSIVKQSEDQAAVTMYNMPG